MPYTYDYPRPALTVDCVIFGHDEEAVLKVLLIERAHAPFAGKWALPGGFVDEGETVEQAALRELQEETGLAGVSVQELGVWSAPGRDPRGWTVSVAFVAQVRIADCRIAAGSDAQKAEWLAVDSLAEMAFDHLDILKRALQFIA